MSAGTVRVLVIKRNNKVMPYPTYRDIVCEYMQEVADLATGGSVFLYGGAGKKVIMTKFQVEQTSAQIKALCQKCCASTSA